MPHSSIMKEVGVPYVHISCKLRPRNFQRSGRSSTFLCPSWNVSFLEERTQEMTASISLKQMSVSQSRQASNPLECDICCNVFSEEHSPRILPCSHTFCSPCIDELILTQKKECPLCREAFTANSVEDLIIIRKLLDVAKQLSSLNLGSKTEPRETKRSFFESTKDFIKKSTEQSIAYCQATEAEARDLLTSFGEMKVVFLGVNEDIEGFQKTMEELKLSNEHKVGDIDQCADLLGNKLQPMLQGVEDIKVFDAKVTSVADFASNGLLLDETGTIVDDVRGKTMELQDLVQKKKGDRENFKKEILKMRARFRNLSDNIEERIQADSRGIFVVMTFEGIQRVGPVKVESNYQLYINHLQQGVLPPRCFVIELESLMQGSPPPPPPSPSSSLPRAFLDLAYESTHLGRIIIRVTENGIWVLNFLYMCAGGMGPSFANSQVIDVKRHRFGGDYISMGEYVSHGGGGTLTQKPLSSREDWESEMKMKTYKLTPWKAGEMRGFISYEEGSQFWIITRDYPSCDSGYCFGKVEEGLDVLRDASLKYPDHKGIKVTNCGLIL